MVEHDIDIKKIQAQSGHRDVKTLYKYVQYSSKAIREYYDRVFESQEQPSSIHHENRESLTGDIIKNYKERIMTKYLNNEINLETMTMMLKTFEEKSNYKTPENVIYIY